MLCIALGMAELSSAYPTSGGMYYWQYKLAGRRVGPFACWLTGMLLLFLKSEIAGDSWAREPQHQPMQQHTS
jgi:amino acid transporter